MKNIVGTVVVSVFKDENQNTSFEVKTRDENVLPVVYVIEDTLKLYQDSNYTKKVLNFVEDFLFFIKFLFVYFYLLIS